jgi:hypothetical protein
MIIAQGEYGNRDIIASPITVNIPLRVCTGFWWGSRMERDYWGDPDVDGRIILKWIFRKWEGVVGTGGGCGDWMERAQDRVRWRALVSTVMNFRVP